MTPLVEFTVVYSPGMVQESPRLTTIVVSEVQEIRRWNDGNAMLILRGNNYIHLEHPYEEVVKTIKSAIKGYILD